jgi:tetratricopeptide (TPR) repeat protein
MLLYLRYEERGRQWRLMLSIGVFLLSALAKVIAVTLPVVLLACAWWQRGRITRRDLLQVLPYLLIGVLMTCMEVWSQHLVATGGAAVRCDSFFSRAAVAGCAVWFYLGKLIWPVDLMFVYPRWSIDEGNVLVYLPGMLLAILLALAWWQRRGWGRPVVMLIVCYVALLLPVLGFVNIYFMEYSLVADHWQYAAMIVPCAVFAAAAATLGRRRLSNRPGGYAICLVLLAILASLTWRQSRMYADVETLYRTTIDRNPACWMAYNNLGVVLHDQGHLAEAVAQYQGALEIKPDYAEAHNNLGLALADHQQIDEAVAHYQKALEIKTDYAEPYYNLGNALSARGEFDKAIADYRKALEIKPRYAEAHVNLGLALAARQKIDEAIAHYQKAMEIKPDLAEAYDNLGLVLAGRGQLGEAIAHYQRALEIKPDYAGAHSNLGVALASRGQFDEAMPHFRKALEISPGLADTRNNLDIAQSRWEEIRKALAGQRELLRSRPDDITLLNDTAWMLATNPNASIRNGAEAVALAQRAVQLSDGREPTVLGTLAAAYAEAGRFSEAVQTARKALDLATEQNKQSLAESLKANMRLYEAGTPCHEMQPLVAPHSDHP